MRLFIRSVWRCCMINGGAAVYAALCAELLGRDWNWESSLHTTIYFAAVVILWPWLSANAVDKAAQHGDDNENR